MLVTSESPRHTTKDREKLRQYFQAPAEQDLTCVCRSAAREYFAHVIICVLPTTSKLYVLENGNCYKFHFFLYCTTLLVHVTHVHCLVSLILLLSDSPCFYMTCSDSCGCATIMHDSYGLLVTRSLSRMDQ